MTSPAGADTCRPPPAAPDAGGALVVVGRGGERGARSRGAHRVCRAATAATLRPGLPRPAGAGEPRPLARAAERLPAPGGPWGDPRWAVRGRLHRGAVRPARGRGRGPHGAPFAAAS